jgi:(p)ppGpp synthase/HD superfamily hydrolase
VNPRVARAIMRRSHLGQRNRFGEPVIEHVERVAGAVPPEARTTAWLHDLFELTQVDRTQLRARGLTEVEDLALKLLTRRKHEAYDTYVVRIADAPGSAGRIARMVKLADLDDHLAHSRIPADAPPYAWARRRILANRHTEPPAAAAG